MQEPWLRMIDIADLTREQPRVVKTHGKQIVLFRVDADEVHAIDNRCPHEGYPLNTGALKDGVLTCEWHNWKFRLCDGACLLGGEDVRRYPVRIHDGAVWLDPTDPPNDQQRPALYQGLVGAFEEDDWSRAGRLVERLLAAQATPVEVIGFGCDWAATHAPYGFDHGLATAADIVGMLDDFSETPGIAVLEALNLLVEPNLRRPERRLGAPEPVVAGDWDRVGDQLRHRIEAEDMAGAEGLLRGALAAGAGPEQVFAWLASAVTDHFLGFGHAQIYCVKAEELLAKIGWQHAHPVLTCLVSGIIYETREDRLPYMRAYWRHMETHHGQLARWAAMTPDLQRAPAVDTLLEAVLDGDLNTALDAVAADLDRGVAPHRIALVLALAASYRLLRFDARLEHRDDVSEGWLHITHALTHADAVRETLLRRPNADTLRGLFHSARFVQHLNPCDLRQSSAAALPVPPVLAPQVPVANAGAGAVDVGFAKALGDGDATAAMTVVRRVFGAAKDEAQTAADAALSTAGAAPSAASATRAAAAQAAIATTLRRFVATDSASVPIFVAHHIKTAVASLRLTGALCTDPVLGRRADRDLPAVAAIRFITSPLKERRITRHARIAREFVGTGRMQNKLLGY